MQTGREYRSRAESRRFSPGTMPTRERMIERIDLMLREHQDEKLRTLLATFDFPTAAGVIEGLPRGRRKCFSLLQPEAQAEVMLALAVRSRERILWRMPESAVARFLHFMDDDNATDVLQLFPEERRGAILSGVREEKRKRVEKLLLFGSETAGGLMDLNFVEVAADTTVGAAIDAFQIYAKQHKQVPVVLLHTPKGVQWVPARTLISAPKTAKSGDVSRPVPVIVHTADREDVLDLMGKENSDIVCVIDQHERTLGIIHLNDLLRIAEAEASEDVYRMGAVGLMDASYLESSFRTIWRKRVGWLSVLFLAELFTFTALAQFESSIAAVTALALFVPLCISTGGNSGSQAATLITRAMALGHATTRDWWRVLHRELLMGCALGTALGVVGFARASLTPQHVLGGVDRWMIGLVIGLSVATICLWGTLVGAMLPIAFRKAGVDPAYASSPFVATFVDVTGIVIYFSIANVFILN